MRPWIGMACALQALGDQIVEQYEKDHCICASCWLGFETLYRNVKKMGGGGKEYWKGNKNWRGVDYAKKVGDKYWRALEKNNKKRRGE